MTEIIDGVETITTISGGGGATYKDYDFPAASLNLPSDNYPELQTATGGTTSTAVYYDVYWYDDVTEEQTFGQFKAPRDTITGNIDFIVDGTSRTATASKNFGLKVYTSVNNATTWNVPYSSLSSGAMSVLNVDRAADKLTFSASASDLGLISDRVTKIKFGRDVTVSNNLPGDYGVGNVRMRVRW